MKNSNRKVRKSILMKYLKDLKRITNKKGLRVWTTGGKEYSSLNEVNNSLKIQQIG